MEVVTETVYVSVQTPSLIPVSNGLSLYQGQIGVLDPEIVGELMYIDQQDSFPVEIVGGAVAGGIFLVAIVFLVVICCVIFAARRQSKLKDRRFVNLMSQMETMEMDMADQCKQGENRSLSVTNRFITASLCPLDLQHSPSFRRSWRRLCRMRCWIDSSSRSMTSPAMP